MKERCNPLNDIVLLLTEHLLLLPLTLFLLVLAGWGRLELFYGPVLLFSFLMVLIWQRSPERLRLALCGAMIAVNLVVMILSSHTHTGMILGLVMGTGFLIRSCFVVSLSNKASSFSVVLIFGIFFYFLAAFIFHYFELFQPYGSFLAVAATVTLMAVFFTMNLSHFGNVRKVVSKISRVSRTTRWTNIFLLSLFSILVLFITALGYIDHVWAFFLRVLNFFRTLRDVISDWYDSLFKIEAPEGIGNALQPVSPPAEYSSSWNVVGYYFGLAVMSLGIALALYIAAKKILTLVIIPFIRYLKEFLIRQNNSGVTTGDYEDEVTSLLKEGESTLNAVRKWLVSRWDNDRPYRHLRNNTERARWLYKYSTKKALSKGLALHQAMTSNEVLNKIGQAGELPSEVTSVAAKAYNTARYGSKEPTDGDIEIMKRLYSSKSPRV